MTAQMKKGVLELCILYVVSRSELYGYEIMKRLTTVFTDTAESTVYAILRRLLADGYLACYSKGESNGPPRKYYKTTPQGNAYLAESMASWQSIIHSVEEILKG